MRYIGGKGKIARELSEVILGLADKREEYLEPFIGGGARLSQMTPHFLRTFAGDAHGDVVALWEAVVSGWRPPKTVSASEYAVAKELPESALRGFIGFGCSFGGKWFGGYAKGGVNSNGEPRDHSAESYRRVTKLGESLQGRDISFSTGSFEAWKPTPGTVIYCDPPYASTQGYSTGGFDTRLFWDTCRDWASQGSDVFVSEYEAPDDAVEVWSKRKQATLTQPKQGRSVNTEKLFWVKGSK